MVAGVDALLLHSKTLKREGDVIAKNIAGHKVDGYVRQKIHHTGLYKGNELAGVKASKVYAYIDKALESKVFSQNSRHVYYGELSRQFNKMEEFLGIKGQKNSVAQLMSEVSNSLQKISDDPHGSKYNVAFSLKHALSTMKKWSDEHHNNMMTVDARLQEVRDEINDHTARIAELNVDIAGALRSGKGVEDLKTARRAEINNLAKLIDIRVSHQRNEQVYIITDAGGINLVQEHESYPVDYTPINGSGPGTTFNPFYVNGQDVSANNFISVRGGELAALIDTAHNDDIQVNLDKIAKRIVDELNSLSNQGTPMKPPKGTLTGASGHPAITTATPDVPGQFTLGNAITCSGFLRIGVLDHDTDTYNAADIDISGATSVNDIINSINGSGALVTAALTTDGRLSLTPTPATGAVVWGTVDGQNPPMIELDSPPALTNTPMNFGHFFGMRNIVHFGANGQNKPYKPSGLGIVNELYVDPALLTNPATYVSNGKLNSTVPPVTTSPVKEFDISISIDMKSVMESITTDMREYQVRKYKEKARLKRDAEVAEAVLKDFTSRIQEDSGVDIKDEMHKLFENKRSRTVNLSAWKINMDLEKEMMRVVSSISG